MAVGQRLFDNVAANATICSEHNQLHVSLLEGPEWLRDGEFALHNGVMSYKPFDLVGKVALVTGGNGGIGLGMADALAQAGASVEIWGTNAEKNARALEQLKARGTKVNARIVDVSKEENIVAGFDATLAEFGRVDACFANAGVSNRWKSFLDIGGEDYRRLMSINLDGVIWTLREACRHMKARAEAGDPGGSVVAVASLGALMGAARNQDYTATKAALIAVTNGIAVEFARYGVRANSILPGWVETEMTAMAQANPKFSEQVIARVPSRRWGKPEEFGGIAVYLASDASTFHAGDSILIDGGFSKF
jgi:NAD(P)-dependent dehydrogenase (short-subunit alcohol dehydrogenase family)